jgi:hypothetical protein
VILDSLYEFLASDSSHLLKNQWSVNGTILPDTGFSISLRFDSVLSYQVCLEQAERSIGCKNTVCRTLQAFIPLKTEGLLQNIKANF